MENPRQRGTEPSAYGPMVASALRATAGDGRQFAKARDPAAKLRDDLRHSCILLLAKSHPHGGPLYRGQTTLEAL
jgi:hypothetical protein